MIGFLVWVKQFKIECDALFLIEANSREE